MFVGLLGETVQSVRMCRENIEILEYLTYPGSVVQYDGGFCQDVFRRISLGHGDMDSLSQSIRPKDKDPDL